MRLLILIIIKGGSGYSDFYLYRLAETYLLRAEANYYLGNIEEATADVNIIRQRAKCDIFYSKVNIDDIVDERARETLYGRMEIY